MSSRFAASGGPRSAPAARTIRNTADVVVAALRASGLNCICTVANGAAAALAKATGHLRSLVGAGTGVRFTPTLAFQLDTVPDTARHMEELVARARANDELLARQAADAKPAGDADPYRDETTR